MKTCAVCQQEVTTRMIRKGEAITRGSQILHRGCYRDFRPTTEKHLDRGGPALAAQSFAEPEFLEYASFWRRLGAHFVDGLILGGISIAISFAMTPLLMRMASQQTYSVLGFIPQAIMTLIPIVYCVWLWTRSGATPGKAAMGIKVVGAKGQPLNWFQSLVRYFAYIPSSLVFGLGYLWCIWDPEKRCWHDKIAGTWVIRV